MGSRSGAAAAAVFLLLGGCGHETHLAGDGNEPDATNDADAGPDADTGADAGGGDDAAGEAGDGCVPVPELCDGVDNDCDGDTDEGFDLGSDPANCGACGLVCGDAFHATAACGDGACHLECEAGFVDANGSPIDGCEYECTPTLAAEDTPEACVDGSDNDCDGRTDATDPGCRVDGPEICNGLDDDCDGLTDEDFDLDFDPLNCGECGNECPTSPGLVAICVLGECDLLCEGGGTPEGGCECVPTVDPTETACDGIDDDCDGLVDENFVPEATCGTGWCERGAVCDRGVVLPCVPRTPPTDEDRNCDGIDDDCDGSTDEDGGPCP